MNIKTAIVPVAGLGTRLLPITHAIPKELLPLGRYPTLHFIAAELARAGIERMILVSSHSKRQMERYFQSDPELEQRLRDDQKRELLKCLWSQSEYSKLTVETVIQEEQRGLGHAVLCAADRIDNDPVVVALGDCVMGLGGQSKIVEELIGVYKQNSAGIAIAFEEVPEEKVQRFGIADPSAPPEERVFPLRDVVEKPSIEQAPSRYAIAARYVLGPEVFTELRNTPPGKNNEIQLTDAIRNTIQQGRTAFGVLMDQPRFDMGNIHSYVQAFIQFALADPELREDALAAFQSDSND